MATTKASAPGKVILFGEHAVVYGYPAIAVPLSGARARATVTDSSRLGVSIELPNVKKRFLYDHAPLNDPFVKTAQLVFEAAGIFQPPGLDIVIESDIPIASGLGSGAATATALARALSRHLEVESLSEDAGIADLVYQVEKLHHGQPSGIDNSVVAYETPIYFVKGNPENSIEPIVVGQPMSLLIGDTGVLSSTKEAVSGVRERWLTEPERYENLFARCGEYAAAARGALAQGDLAQVGDLMNQNHVVLGKMGVSSSDLERLTAHAIIGGALGAKLSGAGCGGNMIALVRAGEEAFIEEMLIQGGAIQVLSSIVS